MGRFCNINGGRMKLAIGIPSGDQCFMDFTISLSQMLMYTLENRGMIKGLSRDIAIINAKSSIVHKGRSEIIEGCVRNGIDKVLMVDTDMTFPPSTAIDLLKRNKKIVAANVCSRRPPMIPNTRDINRKIIDFRKVHGVKEVGYVGTGLIMIDVDVFVKLGKPYFNIEWDEKNQRFDGEDYNFCEKAREKDYKIYCDFDLSEHVGHIGTTLCRTK